MPMRRSEIGNPAANQSWCLSGSQAQSHVHFFASSLLKSRYVMKPALLDIVMAATQTMDCIAVSRVVQSTSVVG